MRSTIKQFFVGLFACSSLIAAAIVNAGEVSVLGVDVEPLGEQQYRISVTLSHDDTGWDHYANAWLVFNEDGKKIGERILHHPHVNEQPFTRSTILTIPESVKLITIQGQDSQHALGGKMMVVELPPSP
ncbi:hypothetical protein ACVBE9_11820 [Eionea flava]